MTPPLTPDGDTARQWLEQELSHPEYRLQETLLERIQRWLEDLIRALTSGTGHWSDTPIVAIVVGLIMLAIIVAVIVLRRPAGRAEREPDELAVAIDRSLRPEDHDRLAEAALAAGDPDEAVIHRVRALIARADARGLVRLRDGLTVLEATGQIARERTDLSGDLSRVAELFAQARYARHRDTTTARCTPADAAAIAAVDARLREANA